MTTTPFLLARAADAGTLAAATPADVDLDAAGARHLGFTLANTGANAITTVQVFVSRLGDRWVELTGYGAAIGAIGAGASKSVYLDEGPLALVRLRLTSTTGTTYAYEFGGH